MLLRLLCCSLLWLLTQGADHGTFKDCARVDFCTALRSRAPADNYYTSRDATTVLDSAISIVLTDRTGGPSINVTISGLEDGIFRVQVLEANFTRYQLTDVLDGEPKPLNFDNVETTNDTIGITSGALNVVASFNPFNINFSRDGNSVLVFNGDRLSLAQNTLTAPFSFGVEFPQASQLYGVHEHCDTLALKNTAPGGVDPYRLKNSDVAFYEIDSPMALYGAIPVIYGHGAATAGVFLHNAAEQFIEVNDEEIYWMTEIGALDLFVFLGPKPEDFVRQYTSITGRPHLPQLWTLGYHQSRYSYETQEDAHDVIENFVTGAFPLDGLWLDIDYTDGYKYFTWNPTTYSDPVSLQDYIGEQNKKLITIIDPHIKVETGYSVYDGALSKDLFVKNSDGSVFQGPCWPGISSYMDFLNPDAREFYGSMYSYEHFTNSTPVLAGIWNDMNEPSVFDNSLEMTLPADALHMGNVRHREIHNIYGFLHTIATHTGLLARDADKRPFVLTRSHFAGSQRYTAFWTGDNTADWPYLKAAYQECLNANMLGLVFCGADVGGFFNNPSEELLQRWYQAGAWLPFYRAHSNKDTNRREPYLFGDEVQAVIRDAIRGRYDHINVWYTLFYEHVRTGAPVIRPLYYQYPEDLDVLKIDDQVLLGSDILVKAITGPNEASVSVYFPGGETETWVSIYDDDVRTGSGLVDIPTNISHIPVYYRAGAVIVKKSSEALNTVDQAKDPNTITFTLKDNKASGRIFLDDGVSFKYRDSSDYNYIQIDVNGDEVSLTPIDGDGSFEFTIERLIKYEIVKQPQNAKGGVSKQRVYTQTKDGVLLKDVKLTPKATTILRF